MIKELSKEATKALEIFEKVYSVESLETEFHCCEAIGYLKALHYMYPELDELCSCRIKLLFLLFLEKN